MASRQPSSVSTQASNDQDRSGAEFNQLNDVQPFPRNEAGSADFNNAEIEFPERKDVVQMYKSIHSWAIFSLVLGVISIFANRTLDPVWGVIMCLVALLSWRIKIPAMFIIYSIVMGWAALINGLSILLGGQVFWVFLSLIQIYWTITIVLQYRKYRKLRLVELYQAGKWPERLDPPQKETEISKKLAIVGAILAGICLILLPFTCGGTIIVSAVTQLSPPEQVIGIIISGIVDLAVLALGLSCAALLSQKENKGLAIGGILMSALVLIGWLSFLIIMNLIPQGGQVPSA